MRSEKQALNVFYQHRAELVGYANKIVECPFHAEDVVQEAFLRLDTVIRKRQLDEPLGYLYRIVRNLAIDKKRRNSFELTIFDASADIEHRSEDCPSSESITLHKQELDIVMQAISELPKRHRTALEMHRFQGKKLREIAKALDISIASAHGLILEALEHCRQRLTQKS